MLRECVRQRGSRIPSMDTIVANHEKQQPRVSLEPIECARLMFYIVSDVLNIDIEGVALYVVIVYISLDISPTMLFQTLH